MRLILCYAKLGPMAFVSHLDFQQLWWRVFRLAAIPLEMTQGYNPRPRLRFASPLATGFAGEQELLEVFIRAKEDGVEERLNRVPPRGMKVLAATPVPPEFPKVTALVDALAYRVKLPADSDCLDCIRRVAGEHLLMARMAGDNLELLLKVIEQRTIRPPPVFLALSRRTFPLSAPAFTPFPVPGFSPCPGVCCSCPVSPEVDLMGAKPKGQRA